MVGDMGHTGGLNTPPPLAGKMPRYFLIPAGLPCLERGRLSQKMPTLLLVGWLDYGSNKFELLWRSCSSLDQLGNNSSRTITEVKLR